MKLVISIIVAITLLQESIVISGYQHREQLRPVFIRNFAINVMDGIPPSKQPYHATIILEGRTLCSGALISPRKIVTSAQCLAGASKVDVFLGARELLYYDEPTRVPIHDVTDIKLHESFSFINSQFTPDYDIALVTLPSDVSTSNISPIRLPRLSDNRPFENYFSYVSGWGRKSVQDNYAMDSVHENLTLVGTSTYAQNECQALYGPIINERHLCMLPAAVSSCYGDLGSPLIINELDGLPTLIGIASFGSAAGCETQSPQVFSRITKFLQWLQNNGVPVLP